MKKEMFVTKIECQYSINTGDLSTGGVTNELGIQPGRFFNKGDIVVSDHTGRIANRLWGVWVLESKVSISEEVNLSSHIAYFISLLQDKMSSLSKLKTEYNFERPFTISIATEDAGCGFDLTTQELNFINQISDRFTCFFISKESILDPAI